jgi:hypothetical protein
MRNQGFNFFLVDVRIWSRIHTNKFGIRIRIQTAQKHTGCGSGTLVRRFSSL